MNTFSPLCQQSSSLDRGRQSLEPRFSLAESKGERSCPYSTSFVNKNRIRLRNVGKGSEMKVKRNWLTKGLE